MFIWDEWPQFFRGAPLRPDNWERRAPAVRHRLIEAAGAVTVDRGPDEATPRLTAVIKTKAARLTGAK